jgi:hypothetical protein
MLYNVGLSIGCRIFVLIKIAFHQRNVSALKRYIYILYWLGGANQTGKKSKH